MVIYQNKTFRIICGSQDKTFNNQTTRDRSFSNYLFPVFMFSKLRYKRMCLTASFNNDCFSICYNWTIPNLYSVIQTTFHASPYSCIEYINMKHHDLAGDQVFSHIRRLWWLHWSGHVEGGDFILVGTTSSRTFLNRMFLELFPILIIITALAYWFNR